MRVRTITYEGDVGQCSCRAYVEVMRPCAVCDHTLDDHIDGRCRYLTCVCGYVRMNGPVEVKQNRPIDGRMANLDVEEDPAAIRAEVRAAETAQKIAQERKGILDRLRNAPLRKPRGDF